MLLGLSILVSSKEKAVASYDYNYKLDNWNKKQIKTRTRGGLHGELVKSEATAAGSNNSGSGTFGEAECGHSQFGNFNKSFVICDGCDSHDGSVPKSEKHAS